jgi:hypothetical protein
MTPRFDELRAVAVARIVGAAGVRDADDGAVERVVGVARPLDERLPKEQREADVAVAGEAFVQSGLVAAHA